MKQNEDRDAVNATKGSGKGSKEGEKDAGNMTTEESTNMGEKNSTMGATGDDKDQTDKKDKGKAKDATGNDEPEHESRHADANTDPEDEGNATVEESTEPGQENKTAASPDKMNEANSSAEVSVEVGMKNSTGKVNNDVTTSANETNASSQNDDLKSTVGLVSTKLLAVEQVDPIRNNLLAPLLKELGVKNTSIDFIADDLNKLAHRIRKDQVELKRALDIVINDIKEEDIKGSDDDREINGLVVSILPDVINEEVIVPLLLDLLKNVKQISTVCIVDDLARLNETLVEDPKIFIDALKKVSERMGKRMKLNSNDEKPFTSVLDKELSPIVALAALPESETKPIYSELLITANPELKASKSDGEDDPANPITITPVHIQKVKELVKKDKDAIEKAIKKSSEKKDDYKKYHFVMQSQNQDKLKSRFSLGLLAGLIPVIGDAVAQPIMRHLIKGVLNLGPGFANGPPKNRKADSGDSKADFSVLLEMRKKLNIDSKKSSKET